MIRKLIGLILCLILIFGVVGCGQPASETGDPQGNNKKTQYLNWAATSTSSSFYPLMVAYSDLINKHVPGAQVTVIETGGTADNLQMVERGEADFGMASDPDLFTALEGIGIYEGDQISRPRLFMLVDPVVYYFVVTEESGINSITELNGKPYSPGMSGSSTERITVDALDAIGVEPKYYPGTLRDAIDAVQDRRAVGFTKCASIKSQDAAIMEVAANIPVRVLNITAEEEQKIKEAYPYFPFYTIPNLYEGEEELRCIGLAVGAIVSKDLPEDLVYAAAKATYENMDYIAEAYPSAKGNDPIQITLEYGMSPLHPGVVKYFQEKGYTVPDNLIPPEMN